MLRAVSALFLVTLGCGPSSPTDPGAGTGGADGGGGTDSRPSSEFADAPPQEPCAQMDILFVIDDSGSMRHERDNLRQNFPAFVSAIDSFRNSAGEALDYRVAVTSTTVDYTYIDRRPIIGDVTVPVDGADGALLSDCGMSRRWLERGDADLTNQFSCIADLPAANGLLEMPLLATERAFGDRVDDGTNAGFLRDDALLAIVVLTDEDDCSRADDNFVLDGGSDKCTDPDWPELLPIDHHLGYLDNLKSGRGRWALAAIGGVCADDTHDARPASRLQEMVSRTGDTAVFQSICGGGDLTPALTEALATFTSACEALPPVL
jgi:hypothetical protein